VRLACPHRPPCSGCPRFGEWGIAFDACGTLNSLAATHGLPPVEIESGALSGFRHRARLAIRGRVGSPKIGLFELGSHRVVHIPDCRVQHPLINRVAEVVRGALVATRLTAYSERTHLGLVRYLQVVIERCSQSAQVVLVVNRAEDGVASEDAAVASADATVASADADAAGLARCIELIRARLGAALHSLWLNFNTEQTNRILGDTFRHLSGPEAVSDNFGGAEVFYPPGAFGQSNPEIATRIIAHVRSQIVPGSRVAELYAGVGAIGLSLLERAGELRMNEVADQSLHGLELGTARLDVAARAKVSVVPGAAAEARGMIADADVVIADPPRKGLDAGLTEELVAHPPPRFVYVSCGLDSLVRDTALLTSGPWRLDSLRAFNLIPYTEHVETVACFSRR